MIATGFDESLLAAIDGQLQLRGPNREAVETIVRELDDHLTGTAPGHFEGVVDVATGVGKTYIIAGTLDYLAARGGRNFAVIAPGATILSKTIAQFTAGNPRSLLGGMAVAPVVITADNFRSAATRAVMEDPEQVKLFVFTVQSLVKPSQKVGRRVHTFQEGLGGAFYEHLDGLEDLVVFADEHHLYHGPAFSSAIRDLSPTALIGLTATPDERKLEKAGIPVVYRYPLAAAIADRLVKTPVIVGRRDDRTDERTQLLDGARLIEAKEQAARRYRQSVPDAPEVRPMMLVNCENIDHAELTAAYLRSGDFADGRYADAVLLVHSKVKGYDPLEALTGVERDGSPVRIIVQVGMLKEGWDVKSVYVIASLRASVSEVLTEQTLGRGLRLPFGAHTGWPILDELEVLAHERYEQLLRRADVLSESFVDYRTRLTRRADSKGNEVTTTETVPVGVTIEINGTPEGQTGTASTAATATGARTAAPSSSGSDVSASAGDAAPPGPHSSGTPTMFGRLTVASAEERTAAAVGAASRPLVGLRADAPFVQIPIWRTEAVPVDFTLELVVDTAPFRDLGRRLAVDPDYTLRRTRLEGHLVTDLQGGRRVTIGQAQATDRIAGSAQTVLPEQAREQIVTACLNSSVVPSRRGQAAQIRRLLAEVEAGAATGAEELLSAYPDRVVRGLLDLIVRVQRSLPAGTQTRTVVGVEPFAPRPRPAREETEPRGMGQFRRGVGYTSWRRSLQEQVWFDSRPERDLAVLLDDTDRVDWWARLHRDDLPVLWNGARNTYNPDFLVEDDAGRWVVEIKSDRDLTDTTVRAKRDAALAWANAVNASEHAQGRRWGYLLVGESNLSDARGSWPNLRAATSN